MKNANIFLTLALILMSTSCVPLVLDEHALEAYAPLTEARQIDENLLGTYNTSATYDGNTYQIHIEISESNGFEYGVRFEKTVGSGSYDHDSNFSAYISYVDNIPFLSMTEEGYSYYFARIDKYPNGDLKLRFVAETDDSETKLVDSESSLPLSYFREHLHKSSFYTNVEGDKFYYLRKGSRSN